ncbi:hypothetical protein [Paraflavitalea pollutisoli]|uniref:hypothetical protein n=1 Tax=Paraflavitalea pollutisoli TaxID=3034143 RepID=UPI0023EAA85F|nr:hypothetical protein [Paraflavitalea sp. H1-2-19X]
MNFELVTINQIRFKQIGCYSLKNGSSTGMPMTAADSIAFQNVSVGENLTLGLGEPLVKISAWVPIQLINQNASSMDGKNGSDGWCSLTDNGCPPCASKNTYCLV